MEDKKDLVLVEIDAGVEDIKLRYIFERELAEHLRRKQEHPLKILRKVSEEEAQNWAELHERLDNEISSYYDNDKDGEESKDEECVLVEAGEGDIKQHFVCERGFAEHLKRRQYPIKILRKATKEERQKGAVVEAWLYHEIFHYYD